MNNTEDLGQSWDLHSVYGVHRYSDRGWHGACGYLDNPGISIVSMESIDTLTEGGMVHVDPWTITKQIAPDSSQNELSLDLLTM